MWDRAISRRSFMAVSAMTTVALAMDWQKIEAFAAKMGPKADYPTVVIGAGLGGLCCAAYLAREGIPVTVLEKHDVAGGYATAFDRAGGKFRFEVSLEGSAIKGGTIERILSRLDIMDKLDLVELPHVFRARVGDKEIPIPQQDPEAYIKALSRHFPHEAAGIRGFVQEVMQVHGETQKYAGQSNFRKTVLKPVFPLQYPGMWKVRNKTLADLLDEFVKDRAVRQILSAMWPYYGLPPSKLSGFYYAVATGGYLKNGSYYIKDRSQALSDLLVTAIEQAGGDVRCESEAKEILVEKGSVKGVRTASGDVFPARAVVSNASALTTFQEMLPSRAVPEDFRKRLRTYRPSLSCFMVWLGLNRELRDRVPWYTNGVGSGRGPEADYAACLRGEVETCSFGVTLYDTLFKGYSRPGTSTMTLICLCGYGPWKRFEADYRAGKKAAYYREKARWTDILIQRTEAHLIPGLRSMIEVQEAGTPLTCWRYTGNTQGAIYGFEQSMDNTFMNRIKNRTPVKGLYLASAWGNPGGGYGGVLRAGEQTFEQMMADWG
ncbi:MAG: FAD-dependent oxidoreductase [Deltaproteobacteria bacterium]|nr:FAD-dependent oxidoreductase [Deltaproteobacteria bacterium]